MYQYIQQYIFKYLDEVSGWLTYSGKNILRFIDIIVGNLDWLKKYFNGLKDKKQFNFCSGGCRIESNQRDGTLE